MCFELESNMVVYPISKINRSRNQELEMELVSLTVTPSEPQGKILLPIPVILCSVA